MQSNGRRRYFVRSVPTIGERSPGATMTPFRNLPLSIRYSSPTAGSGDGPAMAASARTTQALGSSSRRCELTVQLPPRALSSITSLNSSEEVRSSNSRTRRLVAKRRPSDAAARRGRRRQGDRAGSPEPPSRHPGRVPKETTNQRDEGVMPRNDGAVVTESDRQPGRHRSPRREQVGLSSGSGFNKCLRNQQARRDIARNR